MKRVFALALVALLTACGGGGGGGGGGFAYPVAVDPVPVAPAPAPAANPKCTAYIGGDSLARGDSGKGRLLHPPAERIKEWRPAYTVTDASVSGQAITEEIERFVNTHIPQRFAVIEWGVNDVNKDLDFEEPLRRAVRHAKASGAVVIMTGLWYAVKNPERYEIGRKISVEEGVGYAAWEQYAGLPIIAPDDGHPTQESSDFIWGKVVEIMDAVAPECKL